MPIAFVALLLAALLLPQQEIYPDSAWLRHKPGTWVKNKTTSQSPAATGIAENVQKILLKEVKGDDFVIEETVEENGRGPKINKRSKGVKTGEETLTIGDNAYQCTVLTVNGSNERGKVVTKYWTPAGAKNPLKISFEEPAMNGILKAVAVEEKVEALGKVLICNRLEGWVKMGQADGKMVLVVCDDIPGAQVRCQINFKTPGGDTIFKYELQEVHEEK